MAEALDLLAENPAARVLAGSTDWGVELNIRHSRAALTIGIDRLTELRQFEVGADSIDIGAALTLSEAERALAGRVPLLAQMFPQFASRLIRNGATFGGNLGTGSPIGDSPPALLALDATLVLTSRDGDREVPLSGYFTGYRQTLKRPDELITTIRIPLPVAPISAFHKIAKRRFDDISSVAVGFALRLMRAGTAMRASSATSRSASAGSRPLRCGRCAPRSSWPASPGPATVIGQAAEVLNAEATPISDHRASAAVPDRDARRVAAQVPRRERRQSTARVFQEV